MPQPTINTDDVTDEIGRLYSICDMATQRRDAQRGGGGDEVDEGRGGEGGRGSGAAGGADLAQQREHLEQTWDMIREWLTAHPSSEERHLAATHLGPFSWTALHLVCKLPDPPSDVVDALIRCSAETVTWQDSNGWLPLHLACANGASANVLAVLCDAYPEGKTAQDRMNR